LRYYSNIGEYEFRILRNRSYEEEFIVIAVLFNRKFSENTN
jgi:hypothetical protein